MKRFTSVDEFIAESGKWKEELTVLRDILSSTELEETVKWGAPVYTINEKNVVGLGSFKTYVGIWFFQGVFLKDKKNVLINAQDGKTKALRQWRFENMAQIDIKLIKEYVAEAIENQKLNKTIKPQKKEPLPIPAELAHIFDEKPGLKDAFNKFSPSRQRDFIEHINEAKREETKTKRLQKIIPLIMNNQGLYDKYK